MSQRRIFKYLKENENTMHQIYWDAAKAVLKGKFVALNAYFKKRKRSEIKTSRLLP